MDERPEQPASVASALAAFLALPTLVAFVFPLGIALGDSRALGFTPWGLVVTAIGVTVLLSTVRAFFTQGRGTLAPWNPPRALVVSGLFARCRNPMYVGVLLTIAGHASTFRSPSTAVYCAAFGLIFHLRVVLHEEPWARRTFPDDWPEYAGNVPRWLPRARPWRR